MDEFDYFAKADDDTFLIIENLKRYLAHRDWNEPEFFGHRMYFKVDGKKITYNSGGPGQILSRPALKLMVERSYSNKTYNCMKDGQGGLSMISFVFNLTCLWPVSCLFLACFLLVSDLFLTCFLLVSDLLLACFCLVSYLFLSCF